MSTVELQRRGVAEAPREPIWVPDTFVIIFFVVLAAVLLTHLVPAGQFETREVTYTVGGTEATKTVLVEGSFRYAAEAETDAAAATGGAAASAAAEVKPDGIGLFESGGGVGLFNYAFEGLVSGDKWGSAVGIVAFILIVGGSFGIILRTGAIEDGIVLLIDKTKGREILFIPVMFTLFALGGAVYGMGEEVIAFAMIIVPLAVALGYNALTGVMMTYLASQIGFGTSWMNPFSVAVAQGIAGVPVLSGALFRVVMWATFVGAGIAYTMWYASRIKRNPAASLSLEADEYFRKDIAEQQARREFTLGHWLVLATFVAGIVWIVWGVVVHAYYIPEIASQFFVIGIAAGIIGVIFRLNGMGVNDVAAGFREGLRDIVPSAMIVGMARGIILVLGGDDSASPSVLNTILHHAGQALDGLAPMLGAWLMLVFQTVFNFFISSGSGQAALTMPLMAPLSDMAGVSRQVAVLAFQLGDGITNSVIPTSAALMGVLGVARVSWPVWIMHIWPFWLITFLLGTAFVLLGVVYF